MDGGRLRHAGEGGAGRKRGRRPDHGLPGPALSHRARSIASPPPAFAAGARGDRWDHGRRSEVLCLSHPDWLHHTLTVTGPEAELAAFRQAACGAGVTPWVYDYDRMAEDWFNLMVAPPPPLRRTISAAGARILANQLRDAVWERHEAAVSQVGVSKACPFDLHALVPVPFEMLRLGPDDPRALAWLWEHWGTTWSLRQVAPAPLAGIEAALPDDQATRRVPLPVLGGGLDPLAGARRGAAAVAGASHRRPAELRARRDRGRWSEAPACCGGRWRAARRRPCRRTGSCSTARRRAARKTAGRRPSPAANLCSIALCLRSAGSPTSPGQAGDGTARSRALAPQPPCYGKVVAVCRSLCETCCISFGNSVALRRAVAGGIERRLPIVTLPPF